MGERFLFFLGSAIIATALALLATYADYKGIAETIILLVATTGSLISLIEYFRRKP
jgi:hypothetical protein